MERRRRAQTAGAIFRGLGSNRPGHGRRPETIVVNPVCLKHPCRPAAATQAAMPMNVTYHGPGDLSEVIPVFPLSGALLLPRGQLPLNIFEPRYLAMIDDAFRSGQRLIGMIQPDAAHPGSEHRPNLYKIGCVGRITQLAETGDGRYLLQLTGIARFRVEEEISTTTAY